MRASDEYVKELNAIGQLADMVFNHSTPPKDIALDGYFNITERLADLECSLTSDMEELAAMMQPCIGKVEFDEVFGKLTQAFDNAAYSRAQVIKTMFVADSRMMELGYIGTPGSA